ncbi:MAG: alcohol dehydrogenase catalytic domain-containing protein [bacterium]
MKAFLYKDKKNLELKNIEKPELENQGAIIKINGCGLCGSDIVKFKEGTVKEGTVLGHEVVGIIEEIKTKTDFKIGDRVVLGHHVPCYNCVYCKNQNYSMCHEFKSSNIIPGGFCEYIYVSEKHLDDTVQKVPENLSDMQASFTEPSACCLRAIRRADIKKGDIVMVIGLGSIGLLMGQILKSFGAVVIGCDLIDERIKLAEDLGFDKVYKYSSDEEISEYCRADFQKEAMDKVFLASGSEKSISLALKCVRNGGIICVFASVSSFEKGFSNNEIYYRDLTVFGSYSPASSDLKDSLNLLKNNIIKVERLITEYKFDETNQAIQDTLSNRIIKAYIKIN